MRLRRKVGVRSARPTRAAYLHAGQCRAESTVAAARLWLPFDLGTSRIRGSCASRSRLGRSTSREHAAAGLQRLDDAADRAAARSQLSGPWTWSRPRICSGPGHCNVSCRRETRSAAFPATAPAHAHHYGGSKAFLNRWTVQPGRRVTDASCVNGSRAAALRRRCCSDIRSLIL